MAGPQRKAQPDIYTVLLAIALVAMIICIILLYMETADYGPNKTSGVPRVVRCEMPPTFTISKAVCYTPLPNTNEMHGCSLDFAFGKQT